MYRKLHCHPDQSGCDSPPVIALVDTLQSHMHGRLWEGARRARRRTCEAEAEVRPRPVPLHGNPLLRVQRVERSARARGPLAHLLLGRVVERLSLLFLSGGGRRRFVGLLARAVLDAGPATACNEGNAKSRFGTHCMTELCKLSCIHTSAAETNVMRKCKRSCTIFSVYSIMQIFPITMKEIT